MYAIVTDLPGTPDRRVRAVVPGGEWADCDDESVAYFVLGELDGGAGYAVGDPIPDDWDEPAIEAGEEVFVPIAPQRRASTR